MPRRVANLQIVARRNPQLQSLNEKIARMVALRPWGDIYRSFSFAAQLASEAIEQPRNFGKCQGLMHRPSNPYLAFWYQVRDYNGAAALAVAGGNQTLAEALVTFRFLQEFASGVQDGN